MRKPVIARVGQTVLAQSSTGIYTYLFITLDQLSKYPDLWLVLAVIFRKKVSSLTVNNS